MKIEVELSENFVVMTIGALLPVPFLLAWGISPYPSLALAGCFFVIALVRK